MTEGLILETHLLLAGFEELYLFPLCYQLTFFMCPFFYLNFTVDTSWHVSFSIVCRLSHMRIFKFVACVVIFSAISANSFSSASCFCVFVLVAIMTYHGSVFVLVYSGVWWLSGDVDSIWLFLQVGGKKYCCSTRASSSKSGTRLGKRWIVLEFLDLMKLA